MNVLKYNLQRSRFLIIASSLYSEIRNIYLRIIVIQRNDKYLLNRYYLINRYYYIYLLYNIH